VGVVNIIIVSGSFVGFSGRCMTWVAEFRPGQGGIVLAHINTKSIQKWILMCAQE